MQRSLKIIHFCVGVVLLQAAASTAAEVPSTVATTLPKFAKVQWGANLESAQTVFEKLFRCQEDLDAPAGLTVFNCVGKFYGARRQMIAFYNEAQRLTKIGIRFDTTLAEPDARWSHRQQAADILDWYQTLCQASLNFGEPTDVFIEDLEDPQQKLTALPDSASRALVRACRSQKAVASSEAVDQFFNSAMPSQTVSYAVPRDVFQWTLADGLLRLSVYSWFDGSRTRFAIDLEAEAFQAPESPDRASTSSSR